MKVVKFDGTALDAMFFVLPPENGEISVAFESSGGHEGTPKVGLVRHFYLGRMNSKVTTGEGFVIVESGLAGDTRVLPDLFKTRDDAVEADSADARVAGVAHVHRAVGGHCEPPGAVERCGGRGAAIVPGDPDKSMLLRAVRHADNKLKMPPMKMLAEEEIAHLTQWIRDGAVWPAVRIPLELSAPNPEFDQLRKEQHEGRELDRRPGRGPPASRPGDRRAARWSRSGTGASARRSSRSRRGRGCSRCRSG